MVLPPTVTGLHESTGWNPVSPRGVRQFGEVMLDEVALSTSSLLGGTRAGMRPLTACTAAAEELSALGFGGARAEPKHLRPNSTQRRWIADLAYERMTFEHDPALLAAPEADGLGGPARAVVHVCRHRDCPRLWLIWVDSAGQGGTEDLLLTHAEAVRRVAGPTCASIGVFHVGDGRITEVFNCGYQHGVWT